MQRYAKRLTVAEFAGLVRHRRKPKTVAKCQQKAAEFFRRAVDSEFHSLLDLSHTCSSAIDVQASMHLKSLMTRYYKLGSNAGFAQYKVIQDHIANYGKGEKDQYFDVRKFANDLQQKRSVYELVFDLTSGPREVIKPVEETLIELLHQVAKTESRMVEFATNVLQEIKHSAVEMPMEAVMNKLWISTLKYAMPWDLPRAILIKKSKTSVTIRTAKRRVRRLRILRIRVKILYVRSAKVLI